MQRFPAYRGQTGKYFYEMDDGIARLISDHFLGLQ